MFLSTPKTDEACDHGFAWAALLEHFYARQELTAPALTLLKGEQMIEPYKELLVHSSDMTPTLEAFYNQPMRLTVLSRENQPGAYLREVVLRTADSLQ